MMRITASQYHKKIDKVDLWTIEIITVNDGSTDSTLDILKKYENFVKILDLKNTIHQCPSCFLFFQAKF